MNELLGTILQFVEIGLLLGTAAGLFVKIGRLFTVFELQAKAVEDLKGDVAGVKEDVVGIKHDVAGVKDDVGGLCSDLKKIADDGDSTKLQVMDALRRIERIELRLDTPAVIRT